MSNQQLTIEARMADSNEIANAVYDQIMEEQGKRGEEYLLEDVEQKIQEFAEAYAAQEVAKAIEPHKWKPISEIKKDGTLYHLYSKTLHRLGDLWVTDEMANFHTAKYCQQSELWKINGLHGWTDEEINECTHCRVLDIPVV